LIVSSNFQLSEKQMGWVSRFHIFGQTEEDLVKTAKQTWLQASEFDVVVVVLDVAHILPESRKFGLEDGPFSNGLKVMQKKGLKGVVLLYLSNDIEEALKEETHAFHNRWKFKLRLSSEELTRDPASHMVLCQEILCSMQKNKKPKPHSQEYISPYLIIAAVLMLIVACLLLFNYNMYICNAEERKDCMKSLSTANVVLGEGFDQLKFHKIVEDWKNALNLATTASREDLRKINAELVSKWIDEVSNNATIVAQKLQKLKSLMNSNCFSGDESGRICVLLPLLGTLERTANGWWSFLAPVD